MDAHKIIYSLCCAAIGAGLGCYGMQNYYGKELGLCRDYDSFFSAYKMVTEDYYKDVDKDKLEQGMIKGLTEGLDDRFCSYFTEDELAENEVNTHPSTIATGFQISRDKKTKYGIITEVTPDSVAEKSGLKVNDFVIRINGKDVVEEGYTKIIHELTGKAGKNVKITVDSNGEKHDIDLILENNGNENSDTVELLENDIVYYRISNFDNGGAYWFFEDEYKKLSEGRKLNKLIIDLRGNPGGSTPTVVELFDIFDDNENKVVLVDERHQDEKPEEYKTYKPAEYKFDTVIMTSGDTYSSAEILAAFFKDNGMATIVGETTGGKGVFQTWEWLPDKTTITLVKGYYYVNDMPNYNDVGIEPDVYVPMAPEFRGTDQDIQLQKAIELLG